MKRPIKFRGRDIDTGEIIYGDFRKIGIHAHIFKEADCYYEEELIEVVPDSVAQLVGYDANGDEVYEGDIVIDKFHFEHTAGLINNLRGDEILVEEITK